MRIRDSLSGELRELQPGADGAIGMYVCGPTVYNRIHVGNARPFVVFQLMKRYLEWRGQPVLLVENITDINDKIYAAAVRLGVPSDHLAREMSQAYIADTDLLGLGRPDREPRATETMAEIIALIEELIAGGHAYEAGGDVYFAVRSFDRYGMLSNQRIDQLLEGAGSAEPGEHKRDPLDFALWKGNKPGEDTWWDSPWGRGRPGWHIECSAMAERWLGREFALHGGGRDLIFPHHENEIAQSEAGGRPFAQVWAHNGMLRLSGEKMSKSVGNIEPLHEAVEKWGAETLIMFLLRGHYASPIDYDDEALEQARRAAETLRNRLRDGGDGPRTRRCGWPCARRWTRTSTRRGRWRSCSTRRPRPRARWRRCWTCWGWAGWRARSRRRPSCWTRRASATRPGPSGTSRGRMRCATRSRRPAGRCATPPAARCCIAAMTAEVVYGTHPVREALRGRREVLRVYCSDRAARGADWLPAGVEVVSAERLSELAGSDDHQGLVAEVTPYPYVDADRLLERDRALLVALDEVTDPHNLGAVARVCEGAGADGLLITRRRSAAVTAAVCRASAGAVEHLEIAQVENLADMLIRARRPGLWSYAADAEGDLPYDRNDYRDGTVFVLGAEGRGLRPRVRDSCDAAAMIPMRGRVESLNVGTAAAVLLFEAVRQRRGG